VAEAWPVVSGHHLDFAGVSFFSTMEWIAFILRDPRDAKTLATMIRALTRRPNGAAA